MGGSDIKIIGAGLGRTGTQSLLQGMQQLGYTPYHMKEGVLETPGQLERWVTYIEALEGGNKTAADVAVDELIDSMLAEGFDATLDYPACLIYERLMQRFPEAKVVLSVRGSGEQWAKSVLNTIGRYRQHMKFPFTYLMRDYSKVVMWLWTTMPHVKMLENNTLSRDSLVKAHDAWKEQVISVVPKDKLLIFQAKEGWEPLCEFLGVPAPDTPFPRSNSGAQLSRIFYAFEFVADYWVLLISVMLLLPIGLLYYCCLRKSEAAKRKAA